MIGGKLDVSENVTHKSRRNLCFCGYKNASSERPFYRHRIETSTMASVQANSTYSLTNAQGGTCIDLSGGDNVSSTFLPQHALCISPDIVDSHWLWVPPRTQSSGTSSRRCMFASQIVDPRCIQWNFENAGQNQTFYLKSAGSGQYLSTAGEPRDGQRLVAAGSPYAWRVDDEQGVESGVRCVGMAVRFWCMC